MAVTHDGFRDVPASPRPGSADPNDGASRAGRGLSITEAAEFLGVPGPTLRSWERRYGMPTTPRSPGGHRRYRKVELVQLGLMRDEIVLGRRAADAARWVRGLLDEQNPGAARVHALLAASNRRAPDAVRSVLELAHAEIGLATTLDEVVMPAMRQIGAWWEVGDCDIDQESLTTAAVRAWLAKVATLAPAPATSDRLVLLATGPEDFHTLGLEALAAQLAQQRLGSRLLGARTSLHTLLAATAATPRAVVVLVSHLPSQRRSAVASIKAVADSGVPTFYAGNAFLFPASRKGVPGGYLGESIGKAAHLIAASGPHG